MDSLRRQTPANSGGGNVGDDAPISWITNMFSSRLIAAFCDDWGIKFSRATGNLAHRCCKVGFDRFLGHDEDKVVGGQDMNEPRSVFFPVYFDLYAVIAAGENVHRNHRNERSEFGVGLQGKLLRQKA